LPTVSQRLRIARVIANGLQDADDIGLPHRHDHTTVRASSLVATFPIDRNRMLHILL
jgi:hypothetical protein